MYHGHIHIFKEWVFYVAFKSLCLIPTDRNPELGRNSLIFTNSSEVFLVAEGPYTALHNATHSYSDQANPIVDPPHTQIRSHFISEPIYKNNLQKKRLNYLTHLAALSSAIAAVSGVPYSRNKLQALPTRSPASPYLFISLQHSAACSRDLKDKTQL